MIVAQANIKLYLEQQNSHTKSSVLVRVPLIHYNLLLSMNFTILVNAFILVNFRKILPVLEKVHEPTKVLTRNAVKIAIWLIPKWALWLAQGLFSLVLKY